MTKSQDSDNEIAQNRKAGHDYLLLEKMEAGIELKGSEVKAIRDHRVNLADSFVRVMNGQAYVINLQISNYQSAQYWSPDPTRMRRLLLHAKQIDDLQQILRQKGFTCVPLKMYFKRGFVKLLISIAQKKKVFDKRSSIKEQIHRREMDRAAKDKLRKGRMK